MKSDCGIFKSPIGDLVVNVTERGVSGISFLDEKVIYEEKRSAVLTACLAQLAEYFDGVRAEFSVPLDLNGTPFQLSVWRALLQIPYGETASYGGVAAAIGRPRAVRAVGGANHNNPVSIIVPCHRVIGSDGNLTGYGGGLHRKRWLLDHETKYRDGEKS